MKCLGVSTTRAGTLYQYRAYGPNNAGCKCFADSDDAIDHAVRLWRGVEKAKDKWIRIPKVRVRVYFVVLSWLEPLYDT